MKFCPRTEGRVILKAQSQKGLTWTFGCLGVGRREKKEVISALDRLLTKLQSLSLCK